VRVRGDAGSAIELQTSTDLDTWTPHTNATLPTEGAPEVILEIAIEPTATRLFFRIVGTEPQ